MPRRFKVYLIVFAALAVLVAIAGAVYLESLKDEDQAIRKLLECQRLCEIRPVDQTMNQCIALCKAQP